MIQPKLNKIPLEKALDIKGRVVIMMIDEGGWSSLLEVVYEDNGILIEVNEFGVPVRAYQKERDNEK